MRGRGAVTAALLAGVLACGDANESPGASASSTTGEAVPTTGPPTTGTTGTTATTTAAAGAATSTTAPVTFTFRWPAGCSVPVAQAATQDGSRISMRYRVEIGAGDAAAPLLVRLGDFEFGQLNGVAPTETDLRNLRGLFGAMPTFEVDTDGVYLGARDLDVMFEAFVDAGMLTDSAVAQFRANPALVEGLKGRIAEPTWLAWVSIWAAVGSTDAGEIDDDGAVTRFERVDRGEQRGRVTMRAVLELSGAALRAQVAEATGERSTDADGAVSTTVEATFDPTTLRPDRVIYERKVSVTENGSTRSRLDRREMTFGWDAATGCR